jgi:NADH-quinone oxidoreductase subunit J
MNMSLILFYGLGILTIGAGIGTVVTRNVIHAALFLLGSLMGVAGLYVILLAEFLALVQVLIYGGAITIVLLFAIMLTRSGEFPRISDNPQKPLAAVAATIFGILGILVFLDSSSSLDATSIGHTAFKAIGTELFTNWAIPFEVASLVLLVALIGAIVIARGGGRE